MIESKLIVPKDIKDNLDSMREKDPARPPYTQADAERDFEKFKAKMAEIDARVGQMELVHEDLVIVERLLDAAIQQSFIIVDGKVKAEKIRTGWYGRVIACSETESGDGIKECKKMKTLKNKIVSFNPESAYSLNVHNFPEIWVLSVENILVFDNGYDPVELTRKALLKRAEIGV